jgi:hypothetical protein
MANFSQRWHFTYRLETCFKIYIFNGIESALHKKGQEIY